MKQQRLERDADSKDKAFVLKGQKIAGRDSGSTLLAVIIALGLGLTVLAHLTTRSSSQMDIQNSHDQATDLVMLRFYLARSMSCENTLIPHSCKIPPGKSSVPIAIKGAANQDLVAKPQGSTNVTHTKVANRYFLRAFCQALPEGTTGFPFNRKLAIEARYTNDSEWQDLKMDELFYERNCEVTASSAS